MSNDFHLTQEQNTTVAYLNGNNVRQTPGNTVAIEEAMAADLVDSRTYLAERIVFGHGRVALIFRTRAPRGWDAV
jgi:hypothetical protein